MPNWAFQELTIFGRDEKIIRDIHDRIKNMTITCAAGVNPNNTNWIGNLLLQCGFSYDDVTSEDYYCRGWVDFIDDVEMDASKEYYCFSLSAQNAWSPIVKPWRCILDKMYSGICMAWVCEESGSEIFQKYDPLNLFYTDAQFNVDVYVPNDDCYDKYPELVAGSMTCTLEELVPVFGTADVAKIMHRADEISDAMNDEYLDGFFKITPYEEMEEEY